MRELSDLEWLSGSWRGGTGTESTEEHWMRPAGGSMLGMGRTVDGERTLHQEHMVIESRETGTIYRVTRAGKSAMEFRLVQSRPHEVVFENLDHDYPQRVRYWLEADVLRARVENAEGGRRMEWSWNRVGSQ